MGGNKKMRNFQKSNKKIVMLYTVLGIIILGLIIGYSIISKESTIIKLNSKDLNFESENTQNVNELPKCKYEIFQPTFRLIDGSNYDLRDTMEEQNMILYKKIDNYQEYKEIKDKWDNILDMKEQDFEDNFMMITSIWNDEMIGLVVDNIEIDNDTLYISLIKDLNMKEEDKKKIGISYIIPKSMERENISCVRNFNEEEKDFYTGMKIGELEEEIISPTTFQYRNKFFKKEPEQLYNSNAIEYEVVEPEWQDMMYDDFTIKANMNDIDFSSWHSLGNDYSYLIVTDYSEYIKLIKNYNVKNLTWQDFQYIYVIIVVNTNLRNIVKADNIIKKSEGEICLPIYSETNENTADDTKYQGMVIMLPNYMNSASNRLKIEVK